AAGSKDVGALTVGRRYEVTHIFNQAEHGDVDLIEPCSSLARVDKGNILWRSDNNRSRKRDRLRDRELNVAGARWQIEHQIIQFPPFDLPQKLLRVARYHWPAQNRRRSIVEQKS